MIQWNLDDIKSNKNKWNCSYFYKSDCNLYQSNLGTGSTDEKCFWLCPFSLSDPVISLSIVDSCQRQKKIWDKNKVEVKPLISLSQSDSFSGGENSRPDQNKGAWQLKGTFIDRSRISKVYDSRIVRVILPLRGVWGDLIAFLIAQRWQQLKSFWHDFRVFADLKEIWRILIETRALCELRYHGQTIHSRWKGSVWARSCRGDKELANRD